MPPRGPDPFVAAGAPALAGRRRRLDDGKRGSGDPDTPARVEAVKQALRAMGGELKANYLVMGQYDYVAVIEAPDDEAATKFALATGSRGNIRTETLRAFTEDEYRKIIAALP